MVYRCLERRTRDFKSLEGMRTVVSSGVVILSSKMGIPSSAGFGPSQLTLLENRSASPVSRVRVICESESSQA